MRWLLLSIFLPSLSAQTFSLAPNAVRQGGTVHLTAAPTAASARLGKRKVPLYPDGDEKTGLLPVAVNAKPGTYTVEFLDKDNAVLDRERIVITDAHFPIQRITLPKATAELTSSPQERENVNAFRTEETTERFWQEPFSRPIPGCLTSTFGMTRYINGKFSDYHLGLDQRGAAGTHIHLIADGIVRLAEQFELRGGTVAVDHGQGLTSIYLHMSKILAKAGDHVTTADTLGLVGTTGRSTAPHLHWTLYVHGEAVNPDQWIRNVPCPPRAAAVRKTPARAVTSQGPSE